MKTPSLLIFDRDDTLIRNKGGHLSSPKDLEWFSGVESMLRELSLAKFKIAIATNQSGIAKGFYGTTEVEIFHESMNMSPIVNGAIDLFVYCPHNPGGVVSEFSIECVCRKPRPGMILEILKYFKMDPKDAMLFGDAQTDLAAGHAAGVRGNLVAPGELVSEIRKYGWSPC